MDSRPATKVSPKSHGFNFFLLLLVSAMQFAVASAQDLPLAAPENVGMSRERLDRIKPAMEKHIQDAHMAGAICMVLRDGKIAYFESFGASDKEAGKPMRKDAIFRIYSMSKALTVTSAMTLYDEGRFSLNDPVSKYLPEFEKMSVSVESTAPASGKRTSHLVPAERPITIRDLMRHTSGLNYTGPVDESGQPIYPKLALYGAPGESVTLAEFTKRLASAPLVHQPGTVFDYSYSIDVLGRLVEVLSGEPLDRYMAEHIFKPLHMDDTGFYVPESKWDRLATMYAANPDGTITRSNDPMQEGIKHNPGVFSGGGGLASTATDYARFLQMLLNGGELNGVRILSPKTVELMSSDHLGDLPRTGGALSPGYGFGLSFAVSHGPGATGDVGSPGEYNWAGLAGTIFWIDPREKMIGIFMVQNPFLDFAKGAQFKRLAYLSIVK
jgi:CubicO group peptidase (beta-lactamase class C family)